MFSQKKSPGRSLVLFCSLALFFSSSTLTAEQNNSDRQTRETASPGTSFDDLMALSLEELLEIEVVSAGFFTTVTTKAPGYVMVYDTNTIQDSSIHTFQDLIELYVPGAVTGGHDRQGRLIGTRGVLIDNNAKTLAMWDGQHINYRSHFGYMIGLLSPFMGDTAKVEVIHGPGAIQHGSGAINGFINMLPKTGSSHPGFYSRYEYGIEEQSNLIETGYGFQYGDQRDLYVYGGAYDARGFESDELYGSTKNYTMDMDAFGYSQNNYRLSATWNHDDLKLNWFTYSLNPQKNNPLERGYFMNQAMGLRPKYTLHFTDTESLDLVGSIYWGDYGVWGHSNHQYIKGGSERHWEFKPILKISRFKHHRLAVGGLYGFKKFRNQDMYLNAKARSGFESTTTDWSEWGLFVEDLIDVTNQLTMSLGVRYDKYELSKVKVSWPAGTYTPDAVKGHISPRIALAYEINPKTNIKTAYQHGFRMPDAVYYNFNSYNNTVAKANNLPTSPLKPETMDSFELNLQRVFNKRFESGLNLFYNIFTDQLSYVGSSQLPAAWRTSGVPIRWWGDGISFLPGQFMNTEGSYEIWGFEPILKYKPIDSITTDVSYGFAKVRHYDVVQRYPTHQIKVNLMSQWWKNRLKAGVNYVYNSRYTHKQLPGVTLDERYQKDRNLIDIWIACQVHKNLRLKGVVKNIFGDKTPPPGVHQGAPARGNTGYAEPRVYLSMEMMF